MAKLIRKKEIEKNKPVGKVETGFSSIENESEKSEGVVAVYHERKRSYTMSVIKRLSEGNYDAPIVLDGPDKKLLTELEILRRGLRDARDAAEKNEMKLSTDVASVAHDLKTPLSVIAGYAECIQAGMTDKDYPSLIYAKAQEMNDQVIGIVEANRKAKPEKHFEKIDCQEFFEREAVKYSVLAKNKNIKYIVGRPKRGWVYGDANILASIVQNIITNAVKYTDEGGRVRITFAKSAKYYRFTVADNGKGISKTDLPHVFEKYFMADKSRSNTNSSGLGLFTANEYTTAHGGKIKAKSKEGKGSKFSVYIPMESDMAKPSRKFDRMSRTAKLFFLTIGIFFTSIVYRILRAYETEKFSDAMTAVVTFFMCPFVWIMDLMNVVLSNRMFGR